MKRFGRVGVVLGLIALLLGVAVISGGGGVLAKPIKTDEIIGGKP
jgi:hypothetical protein